VGERKGGKERKSDRGKKGRREGRKEEERTAGFNSGKR